MVTRTDYFLDSQLDSIFNQLFIIELTVSHDEYCYDKRTLEEAIIRNGIHIIYVDGYDDNGRISHVSVIPMLVDLD